MMNNSLTLGYPVEIQQLFKVIQEKLRQALPGAREQIDPMANMLAFQLKPGFIGTIFTLIPVETHITVGFYGGASLPDPNGLLEGKGAVHRHVKIRSVEQANSVEFSELLQVAAKAAYERLGINKPGTE